MSVATGETAIPLVVDVDGTLLRADLLWEGLIQAILRRPTRLMTPGRALFEGRAAFKAAVAEASALSVDHIPLEPSVLALIEQARDAGRPIVLASAAHGPQVSRLGERVGADLVLASNGGENFKGVAKLEEIRARFSTFDYVGNDHADTPIWAAARHAFAVRPSPRVLRQVRRLGLDLKVVRPHRSPIGAAARALRPHQWSKNALLALPAIAAHEFFSFDVLGALLAGFVAFSALASAVYIVNDLVDLPNDRAHPSKRHRPLASGELSIPAALITVVMLLLVAVVMALGLPPAFQGMLVVYAAVTTAYSLVLKQRPILDVITLAGLYTIRVVAGAALVAVSLSRWFLAFSVFFFFSLALVKRVVEMSRRVGTGSESVPGRGYEVGDIPVLRSLGTTSVMASAIVYCLYITGSEVSDLYTRPDLLWIGLPVLLYWQSRVWLLAGRDKLHEDPVTFALTDRVSRILLLGFLVVVWMAA